MAAEVCHQFVSCCHKQERADWSVSCGMFACEMLPSPLMHHSSQLTVELVSSRVTWVCVLASSVSSCKRVACSDVAPSRADLLMVVQTLHGQPDLGGDLVVPPTASRLGLYLGRWQPAHRLLCIVSMPADVHGSV